MTWAFKRQILYVFILLVFVIASGFIILYPALQRAPSCTDNKQNGNETGVDCGGSCARACLSEVSPISVLWARSFLVVPGRYNAVAYIVNHNKNAAIEKVSYRFRFADKDNLYIGKREGTTYIPPGGNFAVFEPGIDFGNSIPVYTTFEFTSPPVWLQVPGKVVDQLKILTSNVMLSGEDSNPHLSATLKNDSLFTIPNAGVIAILYDGEGNAVSVSRTYVSELAPLTSYNIDFTWPQPFAVPVIAKELIPSYDVFSAVLK